MPTMEGFEATRRIRRIEKDTGARIPIIALTAYALKPGTFWGPGSTAKRID
jgi:two-component system, sensor histidine kinase and response regulator